MELMRMEEWEKQSNAAKTTMAFSEHFRGGVLRKKKNKKCMSRISIAKMPAFKWVFGLGLQILIQKQLAAGAVPLLLLCRHFLL